MSTKWLVGGVGIVVVGMGIWWLSGAMALPGESVADQGRDHKSREENEKFTYNSNPPTSGPHDPDWIRPGVYETEQDKYKLIHSLEHGYIEFHYNCEISQTKSSSFISVSAHEDEGDLDQDSATPSGQASDSAKLTGVWEASDCQALKDTLKKFKDKIGLKRIIVQPNPAMEKSIIMVAWGRILKMDRWDEKSAEKFTGAFHNKGPEQTME